MKAMIIGGGIGGLTAALALERAGIETHVYERASRLSEVGAGISLWANATNVLDRLGAGTSVREHLLPQRQSRLRTWDGTTLSATNFEKPANGRPFTVGVLHRSDLLTALLSHVDAARIHLNHELTGFMQDNAGVTARFANGEAARGDMLIGADGLNSAVRRGLFGSAQPRYAGYTAWRAVVGFPGLPPEACESWGRGSRFGIVPMKNDLVYWFATKNAPEGERDPAGGVKDTLLKLFRGWHRPIEDLLHATAESAILRNDIHDRDPLKRWTEGRVTLLGDAAHPMTPNLGQGACQAMEDAITLANRLHDAASLEPALLAYQDRRIPRTTKIVLMSRRVGEMGQWENPVLCAARNLMLRALPASATERQLEAVLSGGPAGP